MIQGQRQSIVQQQRLNLSPQLVQSIKLMGMSFADLRERILEEAERNPALEVLSDSRESPPWNGASEATGGSPDGIPARSTRLPALRPVSRGNGEEESDEHREFIEGALHREMTLQEHLLGQLGELRLSGPVLALAELVVQNLDRDGFHQVSPSELPGAGDPAILAEALETVRALEPEGCATRDFQETLVVQAKLLRRGLPAGRRDELLETTIDILENHFHALEKGRPEALIKALSKDPSVGFSLDLETAGEVFDLIRSLEPFPGRRYDNSPGSYIVPDVIVRKTEDGFSVTINEEEIPVLGLSPFFMELEEEPAGNGARAADGRRDEPDRKARDFARESVKEARWFMSTIERRNLTILKLARALIVFQADFFAHGPSHLAPLRMKDIAAEIGMHEATVSRAANGKYLQCEWGLFELRYFFSNQVGNANREGIPGSFASSGEDVPYSAGRFSKQGVKEIIREIIGESREALSDQKIADQLALRGIHIARRTVAKYRNELTIKSSFER